MPRWPRVWLRFGQSWTCTATFSMWAARSSGMESSASATRSSKSTSDKFTGMAVRVGAAPISGGEHDRLPVILRGPRAELATSISLRRSAVIRGPIVGVGA